MKTRISILLIALMISGTALSQSVPESAETILNRAYKQAAKEKKNVFVIFHASWCGWCKKLDASINDPVCKDFFNKNFVFVHLVVLESGDKKNLENPGAPEMYTKYSGGGGGIPFFLIFDKKKTLLYDSKFKAPADKSDKPAQNMGCPAADEEVAAFIEILKKTSKITDKKIPVITERFKKNRS
jgi:thiol-disulfide isomerase/thioredoxin